jgi:hypothetical protein
MVVFLFIGMAKVPVPGTLSDLGQGLRAYALFFGRHDRALMIEDAPPIDGALPDGGAAGDALTLA